jgi:pimeloyl-ACP methyl ester carboxylesterase
MRNSVVFGATLLLVILFAAGAGADGTPEVRGVARSGVRLSLFTDSEMDFQILRSLGADGSGGGTAGEILLAARQIEDGNPASWSGVFLSLAERLEEDGATRLERGHTVSARESYLRASAYYRAAEYYGDPLSPDTRSWGMKCRETFLKALEHFPWKVESVFIPSGKGEDFFPGYFITQGKAGERRKTLMAQSGFDGTAEEMFLAVGRAALDRGYNVLLFEGPGQAGKRRFHPDSIFVSDLGPTVRSVTDFVLKRPEVNQKQIALYGASFGGYFALSGALGEPRLGALILNSPLTDMQEYFFASMGEETVGMLKKNNLTTEDLKSIPKKEMPLKYRLSLLNLCIRFGKPSVAETLDAFSFFRIPDDRLKSLAMPALGLVSAGEGPTPLKQGEHFAATAPKASLHVFERESGANAHCQLDNPVLSWAVALDWLDELFR